MNYRPSAVVLGLIFFAIASASCVSLVSPRAAAIARLSGEVVPLSYDLHIEPKRNPNGGWENASTSGSETIVIRAKRSVDAVMLNASDIVVSDATIDGRPVIVEYEKEIQQLRLRPARGLPAGMHTLHLSFVGNHPSDGFQDFRLRNGDAFATFFEPSSAHASFPCFDEPEFRAQFTLHVRAPSAWTVISNMPEAARSSVGDGTDRHDFETTPPMPTYLLTFDMGAFAHVDGIAASTPIRVFVSPGAEDQARVVLADAQRLLPFYETFFGTRYPMPKLDIVVTDGALQSALEGWGAITFYSEGSIFGQQFFGGMPGRREAVEELAHEMAHQWVGDLVDMRWSRDTFVAEGLAEYAQQRAVAALYPELQSPIDDDRQVEYVIDAGVTAGTVPVVGPVATDLERDDDKTFSVAAYYKGADIVRQWQLLIGDAAFRSGIARYLRTHRDGSATFEDFWKAFRRPQAVSYGDSWLTHPGFPLVDVGITCRNGRSTVDVTQEAFVSDPVIGSAYRRQLWQFPLSVTIAGAEHMLAVPATHHTRFALRGCGVEAIDDTFRPYARILYRGDALRGLAQRSPRERRRFFEDYAAI